MTERMLTDKECAEILCVSMRKFYQVLADNPPPHIIIGSRRRYLLSSVMQWLHDNEVNSRKS